MSLLIAFWVFLLVTAASAYSWGAVPEKLVATLYLLASLATVVARPALSIRYGAVEVPVFVVDFLLLIGLAFVTSRSNRWWLICVTALQGMTVLAHIGKMLNPNLLRLGYQMMATWAALPEVALLAIGVLLQAMKTRSRAENTSPGFSKPAASAKHKGTPHSS